MQRLLSASFVCLVMCSSQAFAQAAAGQQQESGPTEPDACAAATNQAQYWAEANLKSLARIDNKSREIQVNKCSCSPSLTANPPPALAWACTASWRLVERK